MIFNKSLYFYAALLLVLVFNPASAQQNDEYLKQASIREIKELLDKGDFSAKELLGRFARMRTNGYFADNREIGKNKQQEIFKLIIKEGANPNNEDIFKAIFEGKFARETVEFLFNNDYAAIDPSRFSQFFY